MGIAMTEADQGLDERDRKVVGSNGRLRVEGLTDSDRNWAIATHLSPFAFLIGIGPFAFFAPLVIWLIRKDESAFDDDHGREMMNFLISYFIIGLLLCWTIVVPITLLIVGIVNMIRGAVAAGSGEYFRYPMTIRFIS